MAEFQSFRRLCWASGITRETNDQNSAEWLQHVDVLEFTGQGQMVQRPHVLGKTRPAVAHSGVDTGAPALESWTGPSFTASVEAPPVSRSAAVYTAPSR